MYWCHTTCVHPLVTIVIKSAHYKLKEVWFLIFHNLIPNHNVISIEKFFNNRVHTHKQTKQNAGYNRQILLHPIITNFHGTCIGVVDLLIFQVSK